MDDRNIQPPGRSLLLQLPGEIRNQIYIFLFTSTRLTFGERPVGRNVKRMKPAPNSLAILRTCRQIKEEAKTLWLGLVLFNFESIEAMLDKLVVLPLTTLSQIRHARVAGPTLLIRPPHYGAKVHYRLVWALKLLPGLCLDRLTVFGPKYGAFAYDTLNGLIKYGDGWKELSFITPNSEMLGFTENKFWPDQNWRNPQPATWNADLIQRDGMDSGASVVIYRSTRANAPGSVVDPRTRQIFQQELQPEYLQYFFGVLQDRKLLSGDESSKELLVVVKRGSHLDITEGDNSPSLEWVDLRPLVRGMTWAEIRRKCIDYEEDEAIDSNIYDGADEDKQEEEVVELDAYNDADEYSWNAPG